MESKSSKQLVSKCTYLNVLRASPVSEVDKFMEKGGWNLVLVWTNEAIAKKSYPILKEILNLLMITPVSVPRLKSNRFPIVIRDFSRDCEDEATRALCKNVVSRWIRIAKSEEKEILVPSMSMEAQQQSPSLPMPGSSDKELPLVTQDHKDGTADPVNILERGKKEGRVVIPVKNGPSKNSSKKKNRKAKKLAAAQAKKDKEEEEIRLNRKMIRAEKRKKKRQLVKEKRKLKDQVFQERLRKFNLLPEAGTSGGSEEKEDKTKKVKSDKMDKTSQKKLKRFPSSHTVKSE